jgi:hypothetical protein
VPAQVHPTAFVRLLSLFAIGSRDERLSLACLDDASRAFYGDALEACARMLSGSSEAFRAQAALAALMRLVWSLVPARLLEAQSPDVRALAHTALVSKFGDFQGINDATRFLTTIFKRVRQYHHSGRNATSLSLDLVAHQELLAEQGGRCSHCRFEFEAELYVYAAEDEGVLSSRYVPLQDELTLQKTFRKPELDHIVPVVLGGDSRENWQILCRSCNSGKSDQISYLFALAGHNANRVTHLHSLSSAKRYAVIAEAIGKGNTLESTGDGKFYRVFKVSPDGLANVENLVARYE